MALENAIVSGLSQTRRDIYDFPYMCNLKTNDPNKLAYKTERDSQM